MAATCSGSLRREQWGPGAQGIREEGEGHGHIIRRASEAALTESGGGGDDNSDDNHRRGGGALVTNRGREAREERSGVHTVLAKEEERGEG
jgi:hypothetical protein